MATDFTRFDFHVIRFLSSETVKRMTSDEVGQFILLLCEAWVIGKEATLPDDPTYLARIARCDKVSPLVMSKFPVVEVECGTRRQNEPLYREWLAAVKRSNSAKQRGKLGNDARWGDRNRDASSDAYAIKSFSPIPIHTIPTQSNQIKKNKEVPQEFLDDDKKTERENQELRDRLEREARFNKANEGLF